MPLVIHNDKCAGADVLIMCQPRTVGPVSPKLDRLTPTDLTVFIKIGAIPKNWTLRIEIDRAVIEDASLKIANISVPMTISGNTCLAKMPFHVISSEGVLVVCFSELYARIKIMAFIDQ